MDKRVIIAGLYHDTHTFLEGATTLEEFEIRSGEDLISAAGDASPLAGVVEAAAEAQWNTIPTVDMRARPGPVVEDRAVDFFWNEFESRSMRVGRKIDGVLLVLHGAMVSQSLDDVEGRLLARIRNACGRTTPICGVVDLHANFTAQMAQNSEGLLAYRHNPHTDAKACAREAAFLLDRLMRTGEKPITVWDHPRIVWPPTGTSTAAEPMSYLESLAREIESANKEILAVNVFAGFGFADIPETGVSFTAITLGAAEKTLAELRRLSKAATEKKELGNRIDPPVAEVLRELTRYREGPIIITEPSDNVGGGAPGSGNGLLRALLEHSVENAAVVINDPEAVGLLKKVNSGETISLPIGGKGSHLYQGPLPLEVELVSRSDGRFELEDRQSHLASMWGKTIDMGACAVVRCKGIRILLTSWKTPPFDLGQLRSQGLRPESLFVIGVKAAVAHQRAYAPIAHANYSVDTPGPCSSNLKGFPYRKLWRPTYPLDN
jgi:microcystin degradation protein MlrC